MDMNDTVIKNIIDEHIVRTLGKREEREDIDFVDVFYPQLEVICGLDICMDIHNNMNIEDKLKKRGITVSLFNRFEQLLQNGMKFYKGNDNSVESLGEIVRACNGFFQSYAIMIRDKLKADGREEEASKIDERMGAFTISDDLFKPFDEFALGKTNNVK